MSLEENKALIRRVHNEVINEGKLDVMDEIYSTDFVAHPSSQHGYEALKQLITNYPPTAYNNLQNLETYKAVIVRLRTAFPDFQSTVEDQIAEGDKVVTRATGRGTHKGEFLGIAPTHKQVVWRIINISRIDNGKIVENWRESDVLSLLQQLGAIPSPEKSS